MMIATGIGSAMTRLFLFVRVEVRWSRLQTNARRPTCNNGWAIRKTAAARDVITRRRGLDDHRRDKTSAQHVTNDAARANAFGIGRSADHASADLVADGAAVAFEG